MDIPSRSSRLRFWGGLAGGAVGLAALMTWLLLQLSGGDLDRSDKLASIVSMAVTVVTLPLSVVAIVLTLRQSQPSPRLTVQARERLDAMAETLAIAVRAQWEAEERIRRIHDPFPLPARWTNAAEHLMDHWPSINGAPDRRSPIVLDGDGDHLVDTFDRIPSGRLVMLGRAGAGKTTLTSRFVLALLANRNLAAGRPVPVIFTVGSWDPTANSLRDWLTRQLTTTYPILTQRDDTGATAAEQLLVTGRILPVLDGFDELPEGLQAKTIIGINASLRTGDHLLLTSRPTEYATAVATGDVLTAAAVVTLKDLTADDVRSYLPLTTRRTTTSTTKWDPVLDRAYTTPGHPALGEVLSTPLMVTLARTIYSDTNADPTELLDYTTATELEDRLLAGLVPAVYAHTRHDNRPCSAEDAHRHLSFLADHLQRLGTYDLAWWQFVTALPRTAIGLLCGLLITLMTWLGTGMLGVWGNWGDNDPRTLWLAASAAGAVAIGAASGTIIGIGLLEHPLLARLQLRIADLLERVVLQLPFGLRNWRTFGLRHWRPLTWFLVWTGGGMLFGIAASRLPGSETGLAAGLAAGLFAGTGVWLLGAVVRALGVPVEPTETISPTELLDINRATALLQGLIVGIGGATVMLLTIRLAFEPTFGRPFSTVFPPALWLLGWLLAAGSGALLWILFVTLWGNWLIARTWLSLTGRLPWSIMTFLADAHRRGVLRQAGGVYQFRHARLQNHLAHHKFRP